MRSLPRSVAWFLLMITSSTPDGFAGHDHPASGSQIGKKIAHVVLRDDTGKAHAVAGLAGKKALVVAFLSFECPVSTGYSAILADLAGAYGQRGVAFLGLSTSDENDAAGAARHGREFRLPFPVFHDKGLVAADAFQAEITPEVFVLDEHLILRYRGRIDDGYAARLKRNSKVSSEDLRQAIEEVLASKPVSRPVTTAIGCPIPRDRSEKRSVGPVTFYRDVLPILQNRCQSCHRPGEAGPFPLVTYRQALNWASDIKEYTQSRKMPPWKPVAGPKFQNERKLSDREIAALAAWVDGGVPPGDVKDAPPPKKFAAGWELGAPDLVLTLPDEFQLGPSGSDLYRFFVLRTNLPEDRYVEAVEVRPGNRRVVHHAVLFVDRQGRGRRLEERIRARAQSAQREAQVSSASRSTLRAALDHGPGYSLALSLAFLPGFLPDSGLGGWAPGHVQRRLPEGAGYFLPRGTDIILQLHYHRTGRLEKDRTQVGLYFSGQAKMHAKMRHLQGVTVPAQFLSIPAGAERFRVRGSITVRQDCRLHAVMPHMHLLGRDIEVTMTPPDGTSQTLVAVKDWDFNWQETYFFEKPISVKAGTRFAVAGMFDNSAGNPNNPHQPPRRVLAGLETTNEMCAGFLAVTAEQPGPVRFDIHIGIPGWKGRLNWNLPAWGL